MIRREVFKFFNIKEKITEKTISENEVESLFMTMIDNWTPEKEIFAFHLIDNYRSTYVDEFKKKILAYISIALLNPDIVNQNGRATQGPLILMDKVLSESGFNHQGFFDCMEELTEYVDELDAKKILIPLIYECSKQAAKLNYLEDFGALLNAVMMFVTIKKVQSWFCEESFWGLADTNIFENNEFYFGFNYNGNCPCFLDGFLEVFIYENSDLFTSAPMLMNKQIGELRSVGTMIVHKMEFLANELYNLIMKVVRKNEKAKRNFLNYLILATKSNVNRNKMVFDYREVISDGFAVNFNNVLALFCKEIASRGLFKLIDINFMKVFDLESINSLEKKKSSAVLAEENEAGDTGKEKKDHIKLSAEKPLSFSTVVFFGKIMFTNYSYLKFLDHLKMLDNEMYSLDLLLSEHENHSRIQLIKKELESKSFALRIIFSSLFFKEQEDPLTSFMIEFTEHVDFNDLPHLYFDVVFQIQTLLIQNHDEFLSNRLLGLIEKIMSSKIRNLHFKGSVVKILELKTCSLTEKLFHSLILFYSDLHHFDEFFYEKFNIRYNIHCILMNDHNRHIKEMKPSKENLRFVNFVIDDTENQLSSALNSIIKIKKYEERLKHTNDIEEKKSLKNNILRAKKKASSSFIFVDSSLRMVDFLVEECNILSRPEVLKKFVSILNCNLKMIVGPKCNDLYIKNPDDYNFKPKDLLRKIVMIYLKMKDEAFLTTIVQDRSYFNLSLFKRASSICETKYIFDEDNLMVFKRLVAKLERIQSEIVEDDEIVPDEFIDPITCDPINDPVLLLTSNITVDRSTFEAIMLSDQIDPFNREILDETKVKDNVEMKKKLEEYWEGRKKS